MIKLPTIRGLGESNQNAPAPRSKPDPIPSEDSLLRTRPSGVAVQGWQELAAELARSSSMPKFRSAAVYCEVRLMEALRKYSEADSSKRPDKYRIAICTQLLSELCEMSGAFNRVLSILRDEIVLAVYSDYYATKFKEEQGPSRSSRAYTADGRGGAVTMEQTPYFMVVDQLEQEVTGMARERDAWQTKLEEREVDIKGIETRVEGLVRSLQNQKRRGDDLEAALTQAQSETKAAREEAAGSQAEIKRLRRQLMTEQEEGDKVREAARLKSESLNKHIEELQARSERAELERRLALAASEMALHSKKDMVPRVELDAALADAQELKVENLRMAKAASSTKGLAESSSSLPETPTKDAQREREGANVERSLAAVVSDHPQETESHGRPLTPRPDWGELNIFEDNGGGRGTRELALKLSEEVKRLRASYRVLQERSNADADSKAKAFNEELISSLFEAEPDMAAHPLEFQSLFSNFDNVADALDSGSVLPIEPFGLGSHVPRYLRYTGKIAARKFSKQELQKMVENIYSSKAVFDSQRRYVSQMSEYLFYFLRSKYERHADVASVGYNMQLTLQAHAYDSDIEVFLKTLNGEIGEDVRRDRLRMLESLKLLLQESDTEKSGMLSRTKIRKLLQSFFPVKSQMSLNELFTTLDQSAGEMIKYVTLFENDRMNEDTGFLDAVKDQHLAEINEYVNNLESALFAIEDAMPASAQEGDAIIVPLKQIRETICGFDPGKPKEEVDIYMMRGARVTSLRDLKIVEEAGEGEEIGTFFMRLNAGLVKPDLNYDYSAIHAIIAEVSSLGSITEGALVSGSLPDFA